MTLPTLDQLAADPTRAQDLPPEAARDLLAQLAGLLPVLLGQLHAGVNGQPEVPAEGDRLLTVAEAAGRLGTSKDWLYRQAARLPFTVRLGPRQLRFSAQGLARYLRQRQGR